MVPSAPANATCFLTIFGFQPDDTADVLTFFEQFGEILSHSMGSSKNSIHVEYACSAEGLRAQGVNGKEIDIGKAVSRRIFVGVIPTSTMNMNFGTDMQSESRQRNRSSRRRARSAGRPGAMPEHKTRSVLGRSTSVLTANSRYSVVDAQSIMKRPQKDVSCWRRAVRALCEGW